MNEPKPLMQCFSREMKPIYKIDEHVHHLEITHDKFCKKWLLYRALVEDTEQYVNIVTNEHLWCVSYLVNLNERLSTLYRFGFECHCIFLHTMIMLHMYCMLSVRLLQCFKTKTWIKICEKKNSSMSTSLSLSQSSFIAVKHGPCLPILKKTDPGFRNQVPEETSPHLLFGAQDQRLGAEQDQLSCGSTGTSSGNSEEMETCMA